jgi:hypothetical protein
MGAQQGLQGIESFDSYAARDRINTVELLSCTSTGRPCRHVSKAATVLTGPVPVTISDLLYCGVVIKMADNLWA